MIDNLRGHSGNSRKELPQNSPGAITEADVLITEALAERPARQPDLAAENQALHALAQQLMDEPQSLLKALARIAKDLSQAETAGISFLETSAEGDSVFRWIAIAGALGSLEQSTVPGDFSPCSTTIRLGQSQLYAHPERYFTYLQELPFPIVEGLLFPLFVNDRQLGTLAIFSHTEQRQFDREDQRLMTSLAKFTAAALQSMYQRQTAEALLQQEQEIRMGLRENKKRWSAIFSQAAAGLSEIGLDGRFQRVNSELCKILGRSREEILAANITEVTHPDDVTKNLKAFYQLIQTGEPVSIDKRYLRSDGTIVWANSSLTRLDDEQGSPRAVVAVTIDLSDRKRIEDERDRAEMNAKFLAAVSQDLVGALTVSEIVQAVGTHMNRYFKISTCAFIEIDEQEDIAVIHHDWHQEDAPSLAGSYSLSQFISEHFLSAAKAGKSVVVRDVATDPRITNPQRFDALKIGSFINVPFIRNNKWKFTLGVYHQQPYSWRNDEVELICELSARIWNRIERSRAEEALSQSESRLRLILESVKDYAIFTLDLKSTIISWNSGAERILGYTEAEAIGRSGSMIFTPEDLEQKQNELEIQTTLAQGQAEDKRWHVRKDGSRFWASGNMMQLRDEVGNLQGFVKILQDQTAQQQADERFQLLYDTTSDLLATEQPLALMHNLFSKLSAQLELHSYYNFMVEEKNNRPMLHLKSHAGISQDLAQAIEWIEIGEYLCGQAAQQRKQIVLDQTQISMHPDAGLGYLAGITAYAGQPLIVQGRLLGTLSFASHTRPRFTPEEIDLLQTTCDQIAIALDRANLITSIQQQAEELQQANRIKDEFLAVLSHELRSPLNPILGWSRLLQNGKLDAAKTAQALATIERNAKLQSELIEDLLDVSGILRGKLSLNVSLVDIASVIRAAIETVQLAAEAKSIPIEVSLDPNISAVSGDSTRLQQIVWNLLSNAVKFTPAGGQVSVRLTRQENLAKITVQDTGKGIPREFLPYVFDYFRQADSATTRKFGGLGLGLAIVRHLVELHGGTIEVDSLGEGLGSTFTVYIPLMPTRSAEGRSDPFSQASLNLRGAQVLVVDDDTDTREFMVFLLEQAGANVISAASVREALTALTQAKPDILLSDIGMPEMDGYMLLQQVRALPPEQNGQIPAIALTAYAGDFNQQKALDAGFQRHLAKPVEPNQVIKAVADLLEGRRYAHRRDANAF